nr:amidase [Lacisediminimonas profundi]
MVTQTINALANALAAGELSSVELTEQALARIDDQAGEGARAFTHVYHDDARAAAQASDLLRAHGGAVSPLAGIPISIKDLFDVRGEVTLAGSRVRSDAAPATADAPPIARLRQAGAVIIGKTNMSEFAFSGLGLNPHYGTPKSPWDRATGRIPGGSSSGAAVSVSDGMAVAAIGTDTGGSLRIPAAFCGIVGFKPTASRVSRDGAFPLSTTLDSIGPMANSVSCCATVDAILAGNAIPSLQPSALRGLRLGLVQDYVLDGIDADVAAAISTAVTWLSAAGAQVYDVAMPELRQIPEINKQGGLIAAEAYFIHQHDLAVEARAALYDQRIVARIRRGHDISSAGYLGVIRDRAQLNQRLNAIAGEFDLLLMPTVPVVAPSIAQLEQSDQQFMETNGLVLRNPTVVNFMDGCALSLPCHRPGSAPVGLMLVAPNGDDDRLFRIGLAIETLMNERRA